MRFFVIFASGIVGVCLWVTACLAAEPLQALHDRQGNVMMASLVAFDGKTVTIQREDGQPFNVPIELFSDDDQEIVREQFSKEKSQESPAGAQATASGSDAQALAAGSVITLDFPELLPMADGKPAQCEILLPTDYAPDKTFPLLVWFSGGKGSSNVARAKNLVDPSQFIVVALPYPEGRLPRLAVQDGQIDEFWKYLKPMLEKVREKVPNIDPKLRIAGGSSSGGHLVGSGICQKWRGFADYFTAYILHEGGSAPKDRYDAVRGKPVLVVYGEKSTAYEWQKQFNEKIKAARPKLTFVAMPEDGHGLSSEGRTRIREWTDELLKAKK